MKVKTMTPDEIQDIIDTFRAPETPSSDARGRLEGMHPWMFA